MSIAEAENDVLNEYEQIDDKNRTFLDTKFELGCLRRACFQVWRMSTEPHVHMKTTDEPPCWQDEVTARLAGYSHPKKTDVWLLPR